MGSLDWLASKILGDSLSELQELVWEEGDMGSLDGLAGKILGS